MTNSDETPDEAANKTPADETGATGSSDSDSASKPEDDSAKTVAANEEVANSDDELPEWEPLTPELAEEEAMRGDFMLRWAVVLIAFLMACTEIHTTRTLTHIKSGESLAASGFLPDGTDQLAYSTEGLDYSNLNWLFDVAMAQLHSAGGPMLLTLFKALIVAIAFWALVSTSIPGVSTWWNSVCCGVALLVAYPRFTATPDVITLLGLALTFRWLQNYRNGASKSFPWPILVLFVLWANMDPRVYLGIVLVLAYALGDQLGAVFGKAKEEGRRQTGWVLAILCVVCACANPSTFQTLTSPVNLYQAEYPAMQKYHQATAQNRPIGDHLQYYPATSAAFWKWLDQSAIAAFAILLIAVLMFVVHFEGIELGHLLAFLCFLGLACLALHETAAMSMVAAGIAGLMGQKWYKQTFKQEYSVDTKELVFSRGGRAITVLALFAMAFLFASGRISNSALGDAPRVGLGFEPNLDSAIQGLVNDQKDFDPELRVFNFTMEQGDMLAWVNRPHFLDSRSRLFAGTKTLETHDATRRAMRSENSNIPGSGLPDVWKETFKEFDIHTATPRMFGAAPDSITFRDLNKSKDWSIVGVGASSATFIPTYRAEEKSLAKLAKAFKGSLVKKAFGQEATDDEGNEITFERADWAREPTFNQKWVFPERSVRTQSLLKARNYHSQLFSAEMPRGDLMALAYLTIREANLTLAENPNDAAAYRLLASVYTTLEQLEPSVIGNRGIGPQRMRQYQKLCALSQALTIDPNDMPTLDRISQHYVGLGLVDLAVPMLDRWIEEFEKTDPSSPDALNRLKQTYTLREDMSTAIKANDERMGNLLDEVPEEQQAATRMQLAQALRQQGFVLKAIEVLGDDINDTTLDPFAQAILGSLLLDAGRIEDASTVLERMRGVATEVPEQYARIPWQFPAAMTRVANGNYQIAESIFATFSKQRESGLTPQQLQAVQLGMLPTRWSTIQAQSTLRTVDIIPAEVAELRFHTAICYLEEGKPKMARTFFEEVLKICPATPLRALTLFYLELIDGKPFEIDLLTDEWIALADESDETARTVDGVDSGDGDQGQDKAKEPGVDGTPSAAGDSPDENANEKDNKGDKDDSDAGESASSKAADETTDAKSAKGVPTKESPDNKEPADEKAAAK